ncbi:hypothetical protein Q5P01_004571 [Channa striata]|uniref:Pentraxin (PTX) domain-containing protein n=1 Tax=Channa striata TaxID=64152 RepID=A0AA88T2B3_CHASR|nr:hypothetical protein Q5P01_004571 [Channa striata]
MGAKPEGTSCPSTETMEFHTGGGEAGGRWRLHRVVLVVLLWMNLHEHVAVVLRNQKVRTYGDNSRVTQVANTVSIPTLTQLTICFELQRQSDKQDWWLFTYYNSNNTRALSLGAVGNRMTMIINGKNCTTYSDLSPAYFTSQMKPVCVAWKSETGRMEVYLNGTYRPSSFYPSAGESVLGGGTFRLGGEPGFDGYIYNLRLWDRSMSEDELKKLKCDAEGNVIDWDHSNWTIPETVAQTDTTLSCSTALTLRTPPEWAA